MATSKRKVTKEQRERAEIAALEKRLRDILLGAFGEYTLPDMDAEEFGGIPFEFGLDTFGRWLGGIKHALLSGDFHPALTDPRYMEHYDNITSAAKLLHGNGVRA